VKHAILRDGHRLVIAKDLLDCSRRPGQLVGHAGTLIRLVEQLLKATLMASYSILRSGRSVTG
jgi:hypothetical protein